MDANHNGRCDDDEQFVVHRKDFSPVSYRELQDAITQAGGKLDLDKSPFALGKSDQWQLGCSSFTVSTGKIVKHFNQTECTSRVVTAAGDGVQMTDHMVERHGYAIGRA
jgi:hypothetical protein